MGKKKIMVIDDNAVNLTAIVQILESDYDVVPMIAGKRALRYLQGRKVDLILLDVQMPEMDGVETLKEIRKLEGNEETPVFFLTATKDAYAAQEGERLGILDYITKPVEGELLKKKIADATGESF